jgi:hypothetical protein
MKMKTSTSTHETVMGRVTVRVDVFPMDSVEAIDVYEQDAVRFSSGGFRVEGFVNEIPAGTKFIPDTLAYMVEGDAVDAAREFLTDLHAQHRADAYDAADRAERPEGCSKGCTGRMCRDALHCDADAPAERECPYCGRICSVIEWADKHACSDCTA